MHAETRLLIADDDEAIRSLLGAFFRKKGFDVVMAQDGEEASAALRAGVDIALLDLMMPKKTGMQVLEETRELGITTPILLATAHGGESEAVVRALEIGADDYVDKPFNLAVLHARVIVRLRSSRAASGGAFVAPPSTGGQRRRQRSRRQRRTLRRRRGRRPRRPLRAAAPHWQRQLRGGVAGPAQKPRDRRRRQVAQHRRQRRHAAPRGREFRAATHRRSRPQRRAAP